MKQTRLKKCKWEQKSYAWIKLQAWAKSQRRVRIVSTNKNHKSQSKAWTTIKKINHKYNHETTI